MLLVLRNSERQAKELRGLMSGLLNVYPSGNFGKFSVQHHIRKDCGSFGVLMEVMAA
jgi:hypothetical protein